ncbi:MAG: L-lactate dehydrogenase [Candidatus Paceibacterota bacterium]|jgi:L-lactate dehydrogenase
MTNLKREKIAIIGAGAVGSTIAYTLLLKNLASKIILIDINEKKEEGEVMDLDDILPLIESGKILGGDFKDASDADIIILTAGLAQKADESRLDLANKNKEIIKSIFDKIKPIRENSIVLVISNPVDVITYFAKQVSGLVDNQVFGTGTSLDTLRLRSEIGKELNVDPESVEGFVLGEHGDTEFIAWSSVFVGGVPVSKLIIDPQKNINIEQKVKNAAYEIIERKGATFYGIASVVAEIVEAILLDQNKVMTISTTFTDKNGKNVCLGIPAVIGADGIVKRWPLEINEEEKAKLELSAETIAKYI